VNFGIKKTGAKVSFEGKWGIINQEGKEIIPVQYHEIKASLENLFAVRLNDKWGLLDKNGRMITPIKYDYLGRFYEGFASFKIENK
jgi:hypothetical protein